MVEIVFGTIFILLGVVFSLGSTSPYGLNDMLSTGLICIVLGVFLLVFGILKKAGVIKTSGNFIHVSGLPFPPNAKCKIKCDANNVVFSCMKIDFALSRGAVISVACQTDREIQSQYVSSAGGAIGGALLFGPIGAMIGGRAKKKNSFKVNHYLMIAYKEAPNSTEIKYIVVDCTNSLYNARSIKSTLSK